MVRLLQQLAELGGEFRRNDLVGIERKDHVIGAFSLAEVALRPKARPRIGVDGRSEGLGNRNRIVFRTGVDDDDFAPQGQRRAYGGSDAVAFIQRSYQYAESEVVAARAYGAIDDCWVSVTLGAPR